MIKWFDANKKKPDEGAQVLMWWEEQDAVRLGYYLKSMSGFCEWSKGQRGTYMVGKIGISKWAYVTTPKKPTTPQKEAK